MRRSMYELNMVPNHILLEIYKEILEYKSTGIKPTLGKLEDIRIKLFRHIIQADPLFDIDCSLTIKYIQNEICRRWYESL